ncbi:MAG: helix-turn-helix transcriptional regulator [Beijerinckiaceae bacterium]
MVALFPSNHCHLPKSHRESCAKKRQGWRERYIERGYLLKDHIIERLEWDRRSFTWSESEQTCQDHSKIDLVGNEAASFGLNDGFVVPITLPDRSAAAVAVAFGRENADLSLSEKSSLEFMANYAIGNLLKRHTSIIQDRGVLTPRENECLLWAAEGKTDWEIANILGVSTPTVIKHLLSARDKIGAVNRTHMISLSFRRKIVR